MSDSTCHPFGEVDGSDDADDVNCQNRRRQNNIDELGDQVGSSDEVRRAEQTEERQHELQDQAEGGVAAAETKVGFDVGSFGQSHLRLFFKSV